MMEGCVGGDGEVVSNQELLSASRQVLSAT